MGKSRVNVGGHLDTPQTRWQRIYAEMDEFMAEEPEWMAAGLAVVNAWGREEGMLQHLVAKALMNAYSRGAAGLTPPFPTPPPAQKMFRRSVHVPAPKPEPEPEPLPALAPKTAMELRYAGYDPKLTTETHIRLRLRQKGIPYNEIEDAIVHWKARQ